MNIKIHVQERDKARTGGREIQMSRYMSQLIKTIKYGSIFLEKIPISLEPFYNFMEPF